jgi:ABC-type polysaccharide/polyol phosphate transport system ATPase subunit
VTAAIRLDHVTKRYRRYEQTPSLLATLTRRAPASYLDAVADVTLSVERGERVAVMGRNGAGKTSLLSLLAGVTAPSAGTVDVVGRVAPLLAVGVGFAWELTGRENVFVNGRILGLSQREVAAQLDAIVAFSGLEEFLDTPVKTYSSGMFVRLGFAVAAHAAPDLLLVDEVLAVGDAAFQTRCQAKMQELAADGTTVVAVSHNTAALRALCTRAVVLQGGRVAADLPFSQAAEHYLDLVSATVQPGEQPPAELTMVCSPTPVDTGEELTVTFSWSDLPGDPAQLLDLWIAVTTADGEPVYGDLLRKAVPLGAGAAVVRLTMITAPGSYRLHGALRVYGVALPLARAAAQPFNVAGCFSVGVTGLAHLPVELLDVTADG